MNNEFGPRTLTTGGTQATYYLAIPADIDSFSYAVNGSPVPILTRPLTGVDRNGTNYNVIEFENAQPNSNIVVT